MAKLSAKGTYPTKLQGKHSGPRFVLPSSTTAIHNSGNIPLHIVETLACATQSEDCFRFVVESGSLPRKPRLDPGCLKHVERSAPGGPIAMAQCPLQHT